MQHPALSALLTCLQTTLTLIDGGARDGAPPHWRELGAAARLFCFEADPDECARLNGLGHRGVTYVPLALAASDHGVTFHVTADAYCSSIYQSNPAVYENLPALAGMRPVRTLACASTTLDKYCVSHGLSVDALKLDTQGSELDILSGAMETLKGVAFIDVEVLFYQLYKEQPLFADVDRFLREQGFVLWRLTHLAFCANSPEGDAAQPVQLDSVDRGTHQIVRQAAGQLLWGDAQYVRREFTPMAPDAQIPFEAGLKAAIVIGQQGHWDLALEILRKSGDAALHGVIAAILAGRGPPPLPLQDQLAIAQHQVAAAHAEIDRLNGRRRRPWPFGRGS